jgi:hypothetical protein
MMDSTATQAASNPYILLVDEGKELKMRASILFLLCTGVVLGQDTGKLGGIEGSVVNAATGEGIGRAEVVLRRGGGGGQGGGQQQFTMVTTSDAEGRFRFAGVAAGSYFVSVQKQGYTADRRAGASMRPVRVTAAQDVTGLKYKLQPQAVITGRVVDEEGEVVQGAAVAVLRSQYAAGKRRWMQSMGQSTNDLGEFRLFGLPAGRYLVAATPQRRAMSMGLVAENAAMASESQQYVQTFHPGVLEASQATVIEVSPGQTISNIDTQIRKSAVFRIRGRVVDSEAQGETRFGVSALRTDESMRGGLGASTRPDGNFEINGLRAGTYVLSATSYGGRGQAPGQRRVGIARVDVSANMEGVAIEIKSGFKASGSVKVTGGNSSDVDVKSINVALTPADAGMMVFGGPSRVVVSEGGAWEADNVAPGIYRVQASNRTGGALAYLAAVTLNGQDYLGKDIDMTAGPPGPIQITISTEVGAISGRIEGSGEGGAEAMPTVAAVAVDERARMVDSIRVVQASKDGSYEMKGLRPGEYLMFAFNEYQSGVIEDPEVLKKLESKAVKVKAASGETATAQLKMTEWPAGAEQ